MSAWMNWMNTYKTLVGFCLLNLWTICGGYGQTAKFIFEDNRFDQDLIYDQIESILVDRDGFTWIATSTGLYVHNGYDLKTYLHQPHARTSISENFTTTLFEDSQGNIWIGTYNNGLNRYNKQADAFVQIKHDPQKGLNSNKIPRHEKAIVEDRQGSLWVSTENGLNEIDPKNFTVTKHGRDLNGQMMLDPHLDRLWIMGTQLIQYDPATRESVKFDLPSPGSRVNATLLDENGHFWIGTNHGLLRFDPQKVAFSIKDDETPYFTNDPVESLHQDLDGTIWMASGKQLRLLTDQDGELAVTALPIDGENELPDENISGIYGDGKGILYITYESRRVTKINSDVKQFGYIRHQPKNTNSLSDPNVRSIFKDKMGNLWVGTYNGGLNHVTPDGHFTHYLADGQNPKSLPSNYVTAIYVDSRDRLWVGTLEDGYCFVDNSYEKKQLEFERSAHFGKLEAHEFTEDLEGNIWISTNVGFYIYDPQLDQITPYGDQPNQVVAMQGINVQAVAFEPPSTFWFASWNKGVGKLEVSDDPSARDELVLYDSLTDIAGNPLDNRFINIFQEDPTNLWLASNVDGLVHMTFVKGKPVFEKFDIHRGAPANSIYAIVGDDHNNLWLSSRNGLGKFNLDNQQFINYYQNDGLPANAFIWDAYYQHADGGLFFGTVDGLTYFHPDSIKEDQVFPISYLSQLVINHQTISIGDQLNDRVLLNQDIRYTDKLVLQHNESNLSLTFGALQTTDPEDVLFSYQLDGFDDTWINTTAANRIATYTNLKAGTYFFKVRASKNLGQWEEPTVVLEIEVLPIIWRTTWAYLLYVAFFLLLLYLFQRELVNRAGLKHRLSMERYKHDRDNELNQEKFKFFTNLSHELRTPLTLILGPLERMINANEGNNRTRQNLLLMQKQAHRLHKLTTQLMNFRKYEIDNLQLKAAEGNVIKFLKEFCVAFRQHARAKQIAFDFQHEEEVIKLYYDRDKLEIILVNLLSNAFKFTPKKGQVTLQLSKLTVAQTEKLIDQETATHFDVYGAFDDATKKVIEISVEDTGMGISPEQLDHIFERYYQARNAQNISTTGTGIGLEITKNYVEIHKGKIMVSSEVGKGTSFRVWLPMGKGHLTETEIIPNFKPSEHKDHYQSASQTGRHQYIDLLSSEEKSRLNADQPTLLIVDDNPDILVFLRENFESSFNVLTAPNGRIGLRKAVDHIPDLIISDIMMPEVDGLELCDQIKKDVRTSHIPVILLTARVSNVFQAEGLETGADDYVTKPFDEKLLNIRVRNLIESRRQLRQRYSKEYGLLPHEITINKADEVFLEQVIEVIEEHIEESDLKVETIAREVGMSHSVLYKKVTALTDLTVVEFIRTIRLKKASILLAQTNHSITTISQEVGFSDPKYFSKCFQAFFGKTPSSFKKESAEVTSQ